MCRIIYVKTAFMLLAVEKETMLGENAAVYLILRVSGSDKKGEE